MAAIRVAQVMGKMVGGGVESVVMNYYKHIDKSKVQFDFIVDSDSTDIPRAEIEAMGGRIIVVPPYQKLNKYISALTKLFKEEDYKIVHSHINTLSVFPLFAAKKAGVPVRIAHNHSTAGKGEYKKNIMKFALRPFGKIYPTCFAACTKYAGEWMWGKKTVKKGKVKVINNAIDLDVFKYDENKRNEIRKNMGLENKFVIGHVGRFCYQKNQEFAVDIFYEVQKLNPDSVLLLVGSGDTMRKIKDKVHSLGLDNKVLFMGNRNDVCNLYQAMDVFILPSRYEGLGIVSIEAQACGLYNVVSTEVPNEVKVTDNIEFMDLGAGAQIWASEILKNKNCRNENKIKSIAEQGFEINSEAKKVEKIYADLILGID